MRFNHYVSIVCRVFFLTAFVLLGLAVAEKVVNVTGYTILGTAAYPASRLIEFGVILLVFVIALLLRQIREELQSSKRGAVSPPF
jgi:hypothetical protein